MTAVLDQTRIDELTAEEFAIPCEAKDEGGCPNSADWKLWLSHTETDCGVTAYTCNYHKACVEEMWALALVEYPPTKPCPRCGATISPRLGDNVKWTPLRGDQR